jgi:hypothetical protein
MGILADIMQGWLHISGSSLVYSGEGEREEIPSSSPVFPQ